MDEGTPIWTENDQGETIWTISTTYSELIQADELANKASKMMKDERLTCPIYSTTVMGAYNHQSSTHTVTTIEYYAKNIIGKERVSTPFNEQYSNWH